MGGVFGAGAGVGAAGFAAGGGSFGAVIGLSAETRCLTGGVGACTLVGVAAAAAGGVAAAAAGGVGGAGAGFAGDSTFVFFTSFLGAVVVLDDAAALAGFFAVAGLRAGVLLVVLVGISF